MILKIVRRPPLLPVCLVQSENAGGLNLHLLRKYIDLLFYHRGLSCLVAFELKIGEFKPEYVGKINVYLEALDREVKKDNENPSVGVILCASKDDEVVEFALSRSLSSTMVSEYNLKLIDKKLLQKKQ